MKVKFLILFAMVMSLAGCYPYHQQCPHKVYYHCCHRVTIDNSYFEPYPNDQPAQPVRRAYK